MDKLIFRFAADVVTQIHRHDDISVGGKNDRRPMGIGIGFGVGKAHLLSVEEPRLM
jgi:hypothetical protein